MSGEKQVYTRFSVVQRIEHVVLFTSFIVLAVTGLPQKFAEAGISQAIINLLGGIETTRQIHHVAAIVLLISSAFHIVAVGYRLFVMRSRPSLLPGLKDIRDGLNDFLYNFGARQTLSQGGRFTWMEKVEYWALVWGTLVMALTGFFMWNPIATTEILPGEAIPAAKIAHGWEAVLAVTAVIIWHFYSVHLKRFNKSMFTGKMSEHDMLEEHPLELADIKAGVTPRPRDPKYSKRQAIYVPLASVIGAVLVVAIFRFMTFEKTAIDTIPQRFHENVQVFAPLAPTPFPTPKPTLPPPPTAAVAKADWATVGAILEKECATCHNGSVAGLDFTTYAGMLKGGKDGAVIKPGDPANSLIVQKVSGGAHPGKLSPAELEALKTWIANGATETGEGAAVTAPTPGAAASDAWTGGIDQVINAKCAMCHVNTTSGGLSLKTYADALQGGQAGPAIVPNDPAQSVLVQVQQKGGHPGQLSAAELARVIAWIEAGAPETGGGASPSAPTSTPAAPAVATWSDFQAAFNLKCGTCHVQTQLGGLSFKTYADALKGGKSGPAIVPGDPDQSVLVQVQRQGDHPNLLSPQEFDALLAWIKAGAPETASSAPTPSPGTPASAAGWAGSIDQIFTGKCTACHIQAQSGGLSLKTYADALKGGTDGPVIVPNDPDQSVLVQIQQKGGHPGQLTPDELATIIAWIKAGAPEK
jgi:cytochrome b subunit of formate dehydrogenase/cytochrome c5